MPIVETLGALGSFELALDEATPDYLLSQLGMFGHVAVTDGRVDVESVGDGLLTAARYVGVVRGKPRPAPGFGLAGSGMVMWLATEDGVGDVLEQEVALAGVTLTAAVAAVLPSSVTVGTIHDPGGTYTGKHRYQSPREALSIICDAFGVEFRVNGDATLDVGTAAQLYNTAAPDAIVVRRNPGTDMDLVGLGGDYDSDEAVWDHSNRVVLLGQTEESGTFATGAASAPVVPYVDLHGNPVKMTRLISESGETAGSVAARAQLQLNRFNRVARSLKVTAEQYENTDVLRVGDAVYVYDPDTGITDESREVYYRGEVLHPDVVRVTSMTWRVTSAMTVAFRTQAGVWLDLTPFVTVETGGSDELTVGDLPKTLTRPGGDSTIADRVDASRGVDTVADNGTAPNPPTGLTLSTASVLDARGNNQAIITAEWSAPTQNADGTVLTDLANYVVEYRWTGRAPLWQSVDTAATEIDLLAVLGLPYEVRVAAVDSHGDLSAWTPIESITAAIDTTPPLAPSDPVVTSYLGQLRIEWNGLTSTGAEMPGDFNRVDVHVSATSGFTPSTATLVDSLATKGVSYATAPYGSPRYVKLVAYDHNGNASAPSGQGSAATTQVATADIANLAVNNAQIGSLAVGKLTAGIMSADVTVSGRLATALTGARTELNALGLQKWDAANNLLVSITGTDALLTGRYRSAITGRRIEMGSAGLLGEVNFYAPDGTISQLRAYTEAAGVESIQMGIPITGATDARWNKVHVNSDQWMQLLSNRVDVTVGKTTGFFIVRSSTNQTATGAQSRLYIDSNTFRVTDTTNLDRILVTDQTLQSYYWSDGGFNVYEKNRDSGVVAGRLFLGASGAFTHYRSTGGGDFGVWEREPFGVDIDPRFRITDDDVWFNWVNTDARALIRPSPRSDTSARLQLVQPSGYGVTIKHLSSTTGGSARTQIMDATEVAYQDIWAGSYTNQSSQVGKTEIADVDLAAAVQQLRTVKQKRFRRRGAEGAGSGPLELGLLAESLPEEVLTRDEAGVLIGINTGSLQAAQLAYLQALDARLDALEKKGPAK